VNGQPEKRLVRDFTALPDACTFTRENIEGFALDALDRFERGMVEHHLRWCEPCQAEATAFEHVVNHLPYAVPMAPAPGPEVKASLFDRIQTGEVPGVAASRPSAREARAGDVSAPVTRRGETSWWRNASAALIAPLTLALLVMVVWANSLRNDLDERNTEVASQDQLDEALASGGQVALYSVEKEASCPTCRGSGQLGMSQSNDMGMVLGWNFDPNKRHDVWGVSEDGHRTKMCELQVDPSGAVMQMFTFPDGPESFTEVYITDEHGALTYVSYLTKGGDATPNGDRETASPST